MNLIMKTSLFVFYIYQRNVILWQWYIVSSYCLTNYRPEIIFLTMTAEHRTKLKTNVTF